MGKFFFSSKDSTWEWIYDCDLSLDCILLIIYLKRCRAACQPPLFFSFFALEEKSPSPQYVAVFEVSCFIHEFFVRGCGVCESEHYFL